MNQQRFPIINIPLSDGGGQKLARSLMGVDGAMNGTYSRAPVWVPSLRRRQLGSIEPHQRGEGLRHPVGDHRHGAQHDPDLQQRHRHLLRTPDDSDSTLILLHSTDSVEKPGRRVAVPRASRRSDRVSGSARLFVDIFKRKRGCGECSDADAQMGIWDRGERAATLDTPKKCTTGV